MLNTISKSGRVLDLFTPYRHEWGVTEVSGSLGISKSAAHSQLSALAEIGFLRRTRDNRYQLGWRLVSLSQVLLTGIGLRSENRRLLELLARRAGPGCAACLMVLDGTEVLCLDGSSQVAELGVVPATRFPATASAPGKLLLATLPAGQTTAPEVEAAPAAELEQIRIADVAWDRGQTFPGLVSVAAPVRDGDGSVVAAISVSGPAGRFSRESQAWERAVRRVGRLFLRRPESASTDAPRGAHDEDRRRAASCHGLAASGTN